MNVDDHGLPGRRTKRAARPRRNPGEIAGFGSNLRSSIVSRRIEVCVAGNPDRRPVRILIQHQRTVARVFQSGDQGAGHRRTAAQRARRSVVGDVRQESGQRTAIGQFGSSRENCRSASLAVHSGGGRGRNATA